MVASSEQIPPRRYRLIAEIGRGGMAEVYLAVSQSPGGFNKLVVIKRTLENLILRPEILSMFMDEARLAARMNHTNVVQTLELGVEDGRQFIAMEFLDGQPYSRVLGRQRSRGGSGGSADGMSMVHHMRVLIDTLAGLHHAHELRDFDGSPLNVVHRDVTPHNVFITYDGSIKVLDFGIAKASDSSSHTVTGEIKGKIAYMSPEQVRGEPLDRRSDIFAVGVLLWEAVAGRRMWGELPDVTVLNELLQGYVPSIREAVPDVPEHLARIIERATALDREHRYPNALAMQRELDELAFLSGLRIDGPEVGRVVAEMFDEERRRVRAVIEAQLGSLRWTGEHPASNRLPQISLGAQGEASGTGQGMPGPVIHAGGSYPTARTHAGASLSMHAPPPSQRRWAVVLGGASIVLAAALVVVLSLRGASRQGSEPISSASPAGLGPAPSAPSPAPGSDSVLLKVRVTPPEARILLDGELLHSGSFEGKVPRGDAERVLRLEAEGYAPEEEKVTLTSDLMMSFSLEKLEKADGAPPATPSGAPVATPVRPPPARPGTPPTKPTSGRGIDDVSPYK